MVWEIGGLGGPIVVLRWLRADAALPSERSRMPASESVDVQELVGEKGRTGGVTVAAGRSVYARSFGLSLLVEKQDEVYNICSEGTALERVTSVKQDD